MNSQSRIVAVAAAFLLFLSADVVAAPATSEAGLIGKPYAGVDFTYFDYSGSRYDQAPGGSAKFNVPLSPKYDLGFSYDYSDVSGDQLSLSKHAASLSLLTYNRNEYGRAYFSGSIGHAWDRVTLAGVSDRDNGMIWSVRAGYEVPMGERTAVNAGIGYADSFDSRTARNDTIDFRVEASHWLNRNLAGIVSGSYHQIKDAPDAILYTIGLRWLY